MIDIYLIDNIYIISGINDLRKKDCMYNESDKKKNI